MRIGVQLSSLCLIVGTCGCGPGSPKRIISAIPTNTADAIFVAEHAGLAHEASLHHLSVYWNGPNRGPGVPMQIELVKRAIVQNDYGIVLSPAAPFALNTMIGSALAQGIPVVVLGPPLSLSSNADLSYVSNDTDRSAQLAAERIQAVAGMHAQVAIVGIDAMEPGTTECARAFEAALSSQPSHATVVNRLIHTQSWGQTELQVHQMLLENPGISAIYALTLDDVRASIAAISSVGRDGQIKVIGNDQALDVLYELRHQRVDAIVVADTRGMAEQAVENIVALRAHQHVAPHTVFEPILVTRDNIDTEAVQEKLRLNWRPPS